MLCFEHPFGRKLVEHHSIQETQTEETNPKRLLISQNKLSATERWRLGGGVAADMVATLWTLGRGGYVLW